MIQTRMWEFYELLSESEQDEITKEIYDRITYAFAEVLKARYGDDYWKYYQKPIRPSPVQQISVELGMPVSIIRKFRSIMIQVGRENEIEMRESVLSGE